jgi:hypothetical protein
VASVERQPDVLAAAWHALRLCEGCGMVVPPFDHATDCLSHPPYEKVDEEIAERPVAAILEYGRGAY